MLYYKIFLILCIFMHYPDIFPVTLKGVAVTCRITMAHEKPVSFYSKIPGDAVINYSILNCVWGYHSG